MLWHVCCGVCVVACVCGHRTRPRTLELSAADELVAEEHLEHLRSAGFGVRHDPALPPGQRIALVTHPVVAGVSLGPADLDELLTQIAAAPPPAAPTPTPTATPTPTPGPTPGPGRWTAASACSKARAALAMRACRSSIMVGTPLPIDRMRHVVCGLAGLDMPWNCPHGRPTMRHLLDLCDPLLGLSQRSEEGQREKEEEKEVLVDWDRFAREAEMG